MSRSRRPGGGTSDRRRLARIAAIIGTLDADVVALQEVAVLCPDGDLLDEPAELARMTGMAVRYGAVHAFALVEPENGRSIGTATLGNALLTRRPLVEDGFTIGLPGGHDDDFVEPTESALPFAGVTFRDAAAGHERHAAWSGGRPAGPGDGSDRQCAPDLR